MKCYLANNNNNKSTNTGYSTAEISLHHCKQRKSSWEHTHQTTLFPWGVQRGDLQANKKDGWFLCARKLMGSGERMPWVWDFLIGNQYVLTLIIVVDCTNLWLCRRHWLVHFPWVSCVVSELYLSEIALQNKKDFQPFSFPAPSVWMLSVGLEFKYPVWNVWYTNFSHALYIWLKQ